MRMTNILPGAYTNSHVMTVAKHMLAKQAVVSLRDFMYTIFLVGITIQLQNLHNISQNTATILVEWRSPCKPYTSIRRAPIWTPWKNSTYIKETTEDNQLNKRHSIQPKRIFEAIVEGEVNDKHITHPPILPQDKLQHAHSWFPPTTGNRHAQGHLMILHEVNLI